MTAVILALSFTFLILNDLSVDSVADSEKNQI